MTGGTDALHVVRQWVEMAEEDLVNARHTLTLRENFPLSTVCFHAQQVGEKYLPRRQ
jgi:HEPN domain-containing protein